MINKKWQIVFLSITCFLLYARSLNFEFIGLDEQTLLETKKEFNQHLSNIPAAFTQHVFQTNEYVESPGSTKFYRPLETISFIIDQQFSKEGFAFFHFTNILFHILSVCGLLLVLLRLNCSPLLSFLFALLFAVHPLLAQAVAWIPGRCDSMVCAFVLWSLYFLINYLGKHSSQNLFFHLLFFALALFTKENAIMLFPLSLFYIFFIYKKNILLKNKLLPILFQAALIIGWLVLRKIAVGEIKTDTSLSGLYYSFLKNFPLVLQYFQKTILPVNLAVMASVDDTNYGWVIIALALFGTAIYLTKKIAWAEILFGLMWFFLFLLPTLLFSYFEGMEHRSYLPAVGILIAFATTEPIQKISLNKKYPSMIFGGIIFIFFCITFFRLSIFSSELNYWESAAKTSQHSAVVCRDYGVILTKLGQYDKAEQAYLEGIKRNPKETLLHYNLGVMYYKMHHYDEAKEQLIKELNIDTTNFMVYHVLGVIYKEQMRMEEASMMWEQAVELNPNSVESYKELLSYYSQKKDTANFERCKLELEKHGMKIVKR